MNLYDFTKKYGEGKGEAMMWKTVRVISDAVEKDMSESAKSKLMRELYCKMSGGHYDEHFAKEDVAKLYYVGDDGKEHYAPYWTEEQVKSVYETIVPSIPSDYNFWDFYATLQMVRSDNYQMYKDWFPNATAEELDKKFVRSAVNWLNDPDNPYGDTKIWSYLNRA